MLTLMHSIIPFNAYRIGLVVSVADSDLSRAIVKISFWSLVELAAAIISACHLSTVSLYVRQKDRFEDMVILKAVAKNRTIFSTASISTWKNQIIRKMKRHHSDIEMAYLHSPVIHENLQIEHTTYDACRQAVPPTANLAEVILPETTATLLTKPTIPTIEYRHTFYSEYPTRTLVRTFGDGCGSRRHSM